MNKSKIFDIIKENTNIYRIINAYIRIEEVPADNNGLAFRTNNYHFANILAERVGGIVTENGSVKDDLRFGLIVKNVA